MKIGVIGLGFMGSTHLQAIEKLSNVKLAAVMDTDEKRLAGDLSEIQGNLGPSGKTMSFGEASRYRKLTDLLSDQNVEAVDICLPTYLHAPVASQALRAGKHVLLEKPMALDGAACDKLQRVASDSGKLLMIAQVLRFAPPYQELAKLVREGRLGAIRSALFRRRTAVPTWGPWEFDKSKSGGGVFDLLIHDVDMSLLLFGTPEAVSAKGHEDLSGGVDIIDAQFHYPEIGTVTITGGWHHTGSYPFSMEYTVIGERGVVEFSSAGRPATVYWADGGSEALADSGKDPYLAEIEYFGECCDAGQAPSLCRPEDSARAVKATLRMVESRERGGERLPCSF